MALINYAREWQRLLERLEWAAARLVERLDTVQTEEERKVVQTELENTRARISQARAEVDRHTAIIRRN